MIETAPRNGNVWTPKWVIDHERDIYLQSVSGIGRQMGKAFILVHGAKTIPLETEWDVGLKDSVTRQPYFLMHFTVFGRSPTAFRNFGFQPFEFVDDDEKKYWMRIAAEALVVYGLGYSGLDYEDGYTRVELENEHLTLSTFGYEGRKHS